MNWLTGIAIFVQDIPINCEFLDALEELKKKKVVKVHHRDPNRKKITQIVMERTLNDFDPAMILFEYMKQENLRLIDLFRVFDTDSSHTVSKNEMKEGFVVSTYPIPVLQVILISYINLTRMCFRKGYLSILLGFRSVGTTVCLALILLLGV